MSQMAATGDEREEKRARTDAAVGWSSTFPDDLLAVVYCMVASPPGRARFAAVCRSWRAAARAAPPVAALPWLLLSPCNTDVTKRLHCPEDGSAVRVPVPLPGGRLVGSYDGGWIASFLSASLRITNILSAAEVKLGEKLEMFAFWGLEIMKIVFSKPPTSGDCILVAMTDRCYIRLCKVGCPNSGWSIQTLHPNVVLVDITFCNNELYGLRNHGRELVKFQIDVKEDSAAPEVMAQRLLTMESIGSPIRDNFSSENVSYIFDLHGKLAMARRAHWSSNQEPFFKVFELADIQQAIQPTCYKHNWVEVTNLGDHALFLGWTFCKAVHVSANGRGRVERNHIYFSHHRYFRRCDIIPGHARFLANSNEGGDKTYFMEDDGKNNITDNEVERIRSVGYFTKGLNNHGCTWVLPPDI